MYRILAAALAATVCMPPASSAQTAPPPARAVGALTLDRAIALAGASAPGLEEAMANLRASRALRRDAELRPNPSVSIEAENVAGTGPYRAMASAETTLSFAFPVELGRKRSARIALADRETARARISTYAAAADLALRVTRSFIAVAAADRRLEMAGDDLRFADRGLADAAARVRAGSAPPIDEQRAALAKINAGNAMDAARRGAQLARANLARLIGQVPLDIESAWFDRIEASSAGVPFDPAATLSLAAASADVSTEEARERLARSQRIPDLDLTAGARRLSQSDDTAAVIGLRLALPLFNDGSARVEAAGARSDQARAARAAVLIELEQAVATAETELANAAESAGNANGPALAAAREAARVARIGYREGKFAQLDLIEAERMLAQTRTAAIDALAAYHDAKARLARLTVQVPQTSETP